MNARDPSDLGTTSDPLIGHKLGGRFTIVARLGSGSMGAVYRARQDGMSREVALKVLRPERAFDTSWKARFEREARATSALTSPHTVTVYDFGEDESTPWGPLLYLAMEKLEGEPLGHRLLRVGRIPVCDAIRIAQQALQSLAEAHEKGVIHRDLKPDNLFLHSVPSSRGNKEVVKVLDFGIAKVLQPDLKVDSLETQAGTVFGTPRYMSPEQAQSKPLDGRSDLYSIGLILFQMVTGRHVFTDEDAVVVMARHIQTPPASPRAIAPDAGITARLEEIILRALAKDPRDRPQTARELHDELDQALIGLSEASAPPRLSIANSPGDDPTPSLSLHPVADQTARAAPILIRQRTRSRAIAVGVAFVFLLVGAVAVGVRLAQRHTAAATVFEEPQQPRSETSREGLQAISPSQVAPGASATAHTTPGEPTSSGSVELIDLGPLPKPIAGGGDPRAGKDTGRPARPGARGAGAKSATPKRPAEAPSPSSGEVGAPMPPPVASPTPSSPGPASVPSASAHKPRSYGKFE